MYGRDSSNDQATAIIWQRPSSPCLNQDFEIMDLLFDAMKFDILLAEAHAIFGSSNLSYSARDIILGISKAILNRTILQDTSMSH